MSIGTKEELERLLNSIDGSSYPAYKQCRGKWDFGFFVLSIDHVQGDPFAAPSSLRVLLTEKAAGLPRDYYDEPHRRLACEEIILRGFSRALQEDSIRGRAGSGKSGLLSTDRPGQEILKRSALQISDDGQVQACLDAGFPANGRRIHAKPLIQMLFSRLTETVKHTLLYKNLDTKKLEQAVFLSDDQAAIRSALEPMGLVAFLGDGAILPRESGISSRPMKGAVPFASPDSLAVTIETPHAGKLRGMGIKKGVTLIIGGGYHGKSTLLQALETGIYDHIAGDGREYVIAEGDAVKSRAEDGRSVYKVDISLFIRNLPDKTDTTCFSTQNASGSTSQAAGISETIESGAHLLLLDEDTCATNLMVRDEVMESVVAWTEEPICPFVHRVRGLSDDLGISTILVAGSSGAFFAQADIVIRMDHYRAMDVTEKAHATAESFGLKREKGEALSFPDFSRKPMPDHWLKKPGERIKLRTNGTDSFSINHNEVDLRGMEQVLCTEMTAGLMLSVKKILTEIMNGRRSMQECVELFLDSLKKTGMHALFDGTPHGGVVLPRKQEILAALSRYRYPV